MIKRRFTNSFKASASKFVKVLLFMVFLILIQCVVFWLVEKGTNPELSNPLEAAWSILLYIIDRAMLTSPITWTGRAIALLVVIEGIIIFGLLISELTSLRLRGEAIMEKKIPKDHLLICGCTKRTKGIIEGLMPALKSRNMKTKHPIVLLADVSRNPFPGKDIYFVSGDPTKEDDLKAAGVMSAHSAIILADDTKSDPDMRTLLIVLAIETLNRDVYTCAELFNAYNKPHFIRANVDEFICVDELGCNLTATASISHGASKLFTELLTFGAGENECFRIPAAREMIGKTFREVSLLLGKDYDVILLAVERDGEVKLNPKGNYLISAGDYLFTVATEEPVFGASG
jgi:voltage-gated potassium channel